MPKVRPAAHRGSQLTPWATTLYPSAASRSARPVQSGRPGYGHNWYTQLCSGCGLKTKVRRVSCVRPSYREFCGPCARIVEGIPFEERIGVVVNLALAHNGRL